MEFPANKTRVITGLLLALIPLSGIFFQGWVLFLILAVFCTLAQWEFQQLFKSISFDFRYKVITPICTFLILLAFKQGTETWPLLAYLATFWTAGILFLVRYSNDAENTNFYAPLIFLCGVTYIPLSFQFFMQFSQAELFLVLLAAAATDTAAYYTGIAFGKKKIWPSISPKKSWAGSFGGLTACVIVTLIMGLSFGTAPFWAWLLLGVALNIAAQMGDFFESALKRSLAVKDSGTLLPGHGGLLDRVDSLLLVVPVYALLRACQPFFG